MKTTNANNEAKRILVEKLGENYPKSKEELTSKFLLKFADYLDGPDEDDFGDDYKAYEDAKYSSEQWAFISKMTIGLLDGEDAWNDFLNWVVKNYFPEFDV